MCAICHVSYVDAPEVGCWASLGDWSVGYITGVLAGISGISIAKYDIVRTKAGSMPPYVIAPSVRSTKWVTYKSDTINTYWCH